MGNQGSLLKAPTPIIGAYLDGSKQVLITASTCALALWNPTTGDRKMLVPFAKKTAAVYSPNRDELILGEEDGTITTYKASTLRLLHTFKPADVSSMGPGQRCIRSLLLLPNDALCVGTADGSLRAYNLNSGDELWRCHDDNSSDETAVLCLTCSPERNYIIAGLGSGNLVYYNLANQSVTFRRKAHTACVTAVTFLGDGVHFVTAGADGTLRLWDAASGVQVSSLEVEVHSFHYDPMHDALFTGDMSGNVTVFRRNPEQQRLDTIATQRAVPNEAILSVWHDLASEKLAVATADSQVTVIASPLKAPSAMNVATDVKGSTSSSADDAVTLREDDVQAILAKYKQGDWPGDTDLNTVPLFRSTEKLASLSTQMFAPDEMARFHDVLNAFKQAKAELENAVFLSNNELLTAQRALWTTCGPNVDPEIGKSTIDKQLEEQRAEMEERHKREKLQLELCLLAPPVRGLTQLQATFQARRAQLERELPRSRNVFATQALQLRERYRADLHHNARNAVEAFRNLMFQSFPILASRYKLGVPIDSTSGNVYSAFDLLTMEPVVVKAFAANVTLNTTLSHPGLVMVQEVSIVDGSSFVVMKWMEKTLAQHIDGRSFSFAEIATLGASLLRVMVYLHAKRLVVRDLTPRNVYITQEGEAKIVHLGVMRPIGDERPENSVMYSAPELFVHSVSTNSDMWSLALILTLMAQSPEERAAKPLVSAGFPLDISTLRSITELIGAPTPAVIEQLCTERNIGEDEKPKLVAVTHPPDIQRPLSSLCAMAGEADFADLLHKLLQFLPSQRLSAIDALSHPFFMKHLSTSSRSAPVPKEHAI